MGYDRHAMNNYGIGEQDKREWSNRTCAKSNAHKYGQAYDETYIQPYDQSYRTHAQYHDWDQGHTTQIPYHRVSPFSSETYDQPFSEPSTFNGDLDSHAFLDWLKLVEQYFERNAMPEYRKIHYVQFLLRGSAQTYWQGVDIHLACCGRPITKWKDMRWKLREKYVSPHYRKHMFDQLTRLTQGNYFVSEYRDKLEDLIFRCDLNEESWSTLKRFIKGLRWDIQKYLEIHSIRTLDDAYQQAQEIEYEIELAKAPPPTKVQTISNPKTSHNVPSSKDQLSLNDNASSLPMVISKTCTGQILLTTNENFEEETEEDIYAPDYTSEDEIEPQEIESEHETSSLDLPQLKLEDFTIKDLPDCHEHNKMGLSPTTLKPTSQTISTFEIDQPKSVKHLEPTLSSELDLVPKHQPLDIEDLSRDPMIFKSCLLGSAIHTLKPPLGHTHKMTNVELKNALLYPPDIERIDFIGICLSLSHLTFDESSFSPLYIKSVKLRCQLPNYLFLPYSLINGNMLGENQQDLRKSMHNEFLPSILKDEYIDLIPPDPSLQHDNDFILGPTLQIMHHYPKVTSHYWKNLIGDECNILIRYKPKENIDLLLLSCEAYLSGFTFAYHIFKSYITSAHEKTISFKKGHLLIFRKEGLPLEILKTFNFNSPEENSLPPEISDAGACKAEIGAWISIKDEPPDPELQSKPNFNSPEENSLPPEISDAGAWKDETGKWIKDKPPDLESVHKLKFNSSEKNSSPPEIADAGAWSPFKLPIKHGPPNPCLVMVNT